MLFVFQRIPSFLFKYCKAFVSETVEDVALGSPHGLVAPHLCLCRVDAISTNCVEGLIMVRLHLCCW